MTYKKVFQGFYLISILATLLLFMELDGRISILNQSVGKYTLILGLGIPLILLFLGYTQLRDEKVFIAWVLLGSIMFASYLLFKDSPELKTSRGTYSTSLRSLLCFLIVFRIGRVVFVKILKREYIAPSRGGTGDILEGKIPAFADFIMFGVLFFTIIAVD